MRYINNDQAFDSCFIDVIFLEFMFIVIADAVKDMN